MSTEISPKKDLLVQEYDLGRERSEQSHFYIAQHEVVNRASNGKLKSIETYKMHLMCEPGNRSAGETDKYVCTKFAMQINGGPEVSIPLLAGWSYDFSIQTLTKKGLDAQGVMLGISHEKFENLTDSTGAKLSIEAQYQVYSAFIYFHSWCNMLAELGAKDLKKIGDKIVNDESASESPINLGAIYLEGSKFKHGIESLEFKGLGIVDGETCAIVGNEERDGGYVMHMKPMPVLKIKVVGGTRFSGDIYIDLASLWVKKVNAIVTDITRAYMFRIPVDTRVIQTTLTIKSVGKDEFERI